MTDDEWNVAAVADLAAATPGVQRVSLLPYHGSGAGKRSRLGRADPLASLASPSAERMRALAGIVESAGVAVTVGG